VGSRRSDRSTSAAPGSPRDPSEVISLPSNGAVGDLTWRLGDLFGNTRRGSAGGADRFHHPVMPTSGVEGAGEIVYLLRHPVFGMTEELMGDPDMFGIADCELGRRYLAEKMRVEVAAEFAFRDRADALADFFCGKRLAAIADPKRIVGERRRRTTRQKRPVLGDISFNIAGVRTRERHLEGPPVLGFAWTKGNPPLVAATLQAPADGHGSHIARSHLTSREDADHQPVAKQQGTPTSRQSAACLGPPHKFNAQIKDRGRGHKSRSIVACRRGHAAYSSPDPTQPRPIGIRSHHGCGANELKKAAGHGARVIALA